MELIKPESTLRAAQEELLTRMRINLPASNGPLRDLDQHSNIPASFNEVAIKRKQPLEPSLHGIVIHLMSHKLTDI